MTLTMDQEEELVNWKLKEQNGRVMYVRQNMTSHHFTKEIMSIVAPQDVTTRATLVYKGKADPIQYIRSMNPCS